MKKLAQKLFSYKTMIVTDATSGKKETATYVKLLGIVVKIFYTPITTMARTIETIYADLLAKKETDSNLDILDSTSKTAIWRLWLYVTAYAIWVLETLFDVHKSEVSTILAELKPHTARWYRNKALAFQYGFDLYPDTDVFVNENFTEEQISASKIIKYSAVTEKNVLIICQKESLLMK